MKSVRGRNSPCAFLFPITERHNDAPTSPYCEVDV
nr:MAG TPA: hypothetical protein [Caudoviricetes sp.]